MLMTITTTTTLSCPTILQGVVESTLIVPTSEGGLIMSVGN